MSENMLSNITIQEFNSNVRLNSQQLGTSKLRPYVEEQPCTGKYSEAVKILDPFDFREAEGRFAQKVYTDPATVRRWIPKVNRSVHVPIDDRDVLATLADIDNPLAVGGAAAIGRLFDDVIIPAFWATAITGENAGDSTVAFDTNQNIAYNFGGSNGMNTPKLEEAIRMFGTNNVDTDMEKLFCAIGPYQNANLLREVEVAKEEYKKSAVISSGKVREYLGVTFVHTNKLTPDGDGYRRCPMWVKRAIRLGIWMEPSFHWYTDETLEFDPDVMSGKGIIGATRTQEDLVVEIECSEA